MSKKSNMILNLNQNAVNHFWSNENPRIMKILLMMEEVEPWVVDDVEDVSRMLIDFGKKIGNAKSAKLSKVSEEVTMLMAYIYSSKSLRLLNWLDENYPGLSFHYVMEARHRSGWEPGMLLLDRLRAIKTLSLLNSIFSPIRTKLISGLLEEDDDMDFDDDD